MSTQQLLQAGDVVRFLFVGRNKQTGEPVDGYVDALAEAGAVATLAEQGIVASRLRPDPGNAPESRPVARPSKAAFVPPPVRPHPDENRAVVIDRDKIRRNVAAAIDHALSLSFARGEGAMQIRARVAHAIHGLFKDYRNISTETPVDHGSAVEAQLAKLQEVIGRTESMLSNWSRFGPPRGGYGGEGGGTRRSKSGKKRDASDAVLKEIFQANLDLMKSIEQGLINSQASKA